MGGGPCVELFRTGAIVGSPSNGMQSAFDLVKGEHRVSRINMDPAKLCRRKM